MTNPVFFLNHLDVNDIVNKEITSGENQCELTVELYHVMGRLTSVSYGDKMEPFILEPLFCCMQHIDGYSSCLLLL